MATLSQFNSYSNNSSGMAKMSVDEMAELKEQFTTIDKNGDGYIDLSELKDALELCGFKLPSWRVRKIIGDELKTQHQGRLSFPEFEKLCTELKSNEVASTFKKVVSKKENLETLGGMSDASSEGTTHSVRLEEQLAFSDWINSNLGHDPDLKHLLMIDSEGKGLYDSVKDGILLCKVINHSCPDTIDERAINKKNLTTYTKLENLTLALISSQSIGCNIVNIDAHDLAKGKPHLVLGLLWQIIRIGLFNQITLENCPGLATLLSHGEDIADLMKLSPEAILLRWVNYHLEQAGTPRRCNNFQHDITDSEIYSYLLKQIAPQDKDVTMEAIMEPDLLKRAELMLQQAGKLGCRSFVTPADVVNGVYKLNLAFVANLFNNHPGLDQPEGAIEGIESLEETREEKTYRNWMNSMGVSPYVNWLYSDLADGLIIFQLYDIIKPGIVNWNKVHRKFSKLTKFMEKLENCNYAVELGKQLGFSLVGIAGQDLNDGNATLTLALIWQLMRAYTLSVLTQLANTGSPIVEKEIVTWVNTKLQSCNKKSTLRGFQDSSVSDAKVVIDLIDSIKPGTINYDLVKEGETQEEKLANAKYAISMARKTGARVYALPEDITEVKPKMVMTMFACLMAMDYVPNMGSIKRCKNFQHDITDSEIYSYLLKQIAPQDKDVTMEAIMEPDLLKRAEPMPQQAGKLGCRSFVTPADVVNGVYKLNLAFVANLFNNHPGLDQPEIAIEGIESLEETREEKTYRNWMNSMGVSPYVNWLYSDLADGLIIFQLYDIIKPGIVNWNKVHRKFSKLTKFMEKLENCNYAVELGKQLGFSLVGIAGQDLNDGNATLTLALIWQLMRAYTLSVLTQLANTGSPIVEKEIVTWVNTKLQSCNKKSTLRGFQDSSVSDAKVAIDLIDSIKPGAINYDLVKEGETQEEKLANAKYAISMARTTGARVYAFPEDITEVKPKMVMTMFACLMAMDYVPNMGSKK